MRWVVARPALLVMTLLVAVVAVGAVFSADMGWVGEWQWTFDNANGISTLLGPLAGAATARMVVDSGPLRDASRGAARSWAGPLVQALVVWAWLMGVWLVVTAAMIVATVAVRHGGPHPFWALALGPAVITASVGIGLAVGVLWRSHVGAILIAPLIFILGGLGEQGAIPDVFRQGPGSGSLAGVTWSGRTVALDVAALLLLTATLAFFACRRSGAVGRVTALLMTLCVVAFVLAIGYLVAADPPRFVNTNESATVCGGRDPRVCVAPSNVHSLAGTLPRVERLSRKLRAEGIRLPAQFREVLQNSRGGGHWGDLQVTTDANSPVPMSFVAMSLATPADCRAYYNPKAAPPMRVENAQLYIAHWLTSKGTAKPPIWFGPWLRKTYAQLSACDLKAVTNPPQAHARAH